MSRGFGTEKDQARYKRRLNNLLKLPENKTCCECGQRQPQWASVNLGVFFCIRCSGIHRNLGVHISVVRSITLDSWKQEWVDTLEKIGNAKGNQYWEAKSPGHRKPDERVSDHVLEQFIRDKYVKGLWKSTVPLDDIVAADNSNSNIQSGPTLQQPQPLQLRPSAGGLRPPTRATAATTTGGATNIANQTQVQHDPFESITKQAPSQSSANASSNTVVVDFDTFFNDDDGQSTTKTTQTTSNSNAISQSIGTNGGVNQSDELLFYTPENLQQSSAQPQQQQQQQQSSQQTSGACMFDELTNKPSQKDHIMALYNQPPVASQPTAMAMGGGYGYPQHQGQMGGAFGAYNGASMQQQGGYGEYPLHPTHAQHHQLHQYNHQQFAQQQQMHGGMGVQQQQQYMYAQQQQYNMSGAHHTQQANGGAFSHQYSYNSVQNHGGMYTSTGSGQASATFSTTATTTTQTRDVFDGLF